ncbi:hypothetical protein T01_2203 [Trichinella spiralis]|uniref:Uncharacterized protein n=1 Tax=Trichinella spiralis TaxID=6334 RepID=A0A0V1BAP2_TRISP|nr:hypothetical protein T01_2203 [Trichinella spiralis]
MYKKLEIAVHGARQSLLNVFQDILKMLCNITAPRERANKNMLLFQELRIAFTPQTTFN